MNEFIGAFCKNKSLLSINKIFEKIANSDLYSANSSIVYQSSNVLLINSNKSVRKGGSHYEEASLGSKGDCYILSDSRLDYKEELLHLLGIDLMEDKDISDSDLILNAYVKWGKECTKYLYGDFAFVVWNNKSQELYCARDHFGFRPLYYAFLNKCFVFSTNINWLYKVFKSDFHLDDEYLLNCIMGVIPNMERTHYCEISKLIPAHFLTISESKPILVERYWDLLTVKPIKCSNEESVIQEFRRLFFEAVGNRLKGETRIAVELSGGLDSSGIATVASALCRETKKELYAFTHSLTDDQKENYYPFEDETLFSEELIRHAGIKRTYNINGVGRGNFEALEKFLCEYPIPLVTDYPIQNDLLIEEVKTTGCKILLSGFGGDECVTNSGNAIFMELMQGKNRKYLRHQLKKHIGENGGNYIISLYKLYIRFYMPFLSPALLKVGIKKDYRKTHYKNSAVNRKVIPKHEIKSRILKYFNVKRVTTINERVYDRLMGNHISERLEKSYLHGKIHGVEYRYPMLDVKLIEFYFSLDLHMKYRDGYGRYIYRESLKDLLPTIIQKRKKMGGTTIPYYLYRFLLDEKTYRSIIDESEKREGFHYVDYKSIKELADKLVKTNSDKVADFSPTLFTNPIVIIILQKWQREGKIDIGIKC